MKKNKKSNAGFSLVEISIVLVILGLLVGGVLTGQSLISSAEMRSQIKQIEQYDSAVLMFKNRFFELPADMVNPARFSLTAVAGFGNGDGYITGGSTDGSDGSLWCYGEPMLLWIHLEQAGLIEGHYSDDVILNGLQAKAGTSYPLLKIPSSAGITLHAVGPDYGTPGHVHYWWLNKGPFHDTNINYCHHTGMSAVNAFTIDSKIDDAKPFTGRVTIKGPYNGNLTPGTTNGGINSCSTTALVDANYTVYKGTDDNCDVRVKALHLN